MRCETNTFIGEYQPRQEALGLTICNTSHFITWYSDHSILGETRAEMKFWRHMKHYRGKTNAATSKEAAARLCVMA